MKSWDLVIWLNKGSWSHHTAIYLWMSGGVTMIYDVYENKKKFTARVQPYLEKYQYIYICNPISCGFKPSFYKKYKNLLK